MSFQFQFFGFEPDSDLKRSAHRSLEKLLDLSPYGSVPAALLEKTPDGFRCAIDLYTRAGPFISHSYQSSPSQALLQVCEVLQKKLAEWRELRSKIQSEEEPHIKVESVA